MDFIDQLLDEITLDDLREDQRDLAEIVGLKAYRALVRNFGGNQIRIYQAKTIVAPRRDRLIRSMYDGTNEKQLSIKFGLSDRVIRDIIRGPKPKGSLPLSRAGS